LHARFRELDEDSILAAGQLISRVVRKVRNSGARICEMAMPAVSLSPAKAAKTRRKCKPAKATKTRPKRKPAKSNKK
jgi:hypothetical protein